MDLNARQLTRRIYSGLMQWTNGAYKESWTFAGTTLSEMPTSIALLLQFCTYRQLLELKLLAFLSGTLHILLFISAYCANK